MAKEVQSSYREITQEIRDTAFRCGQNGLGLRDTARVLGLPVSRIRGELSEDWEAGKADIKARAGATLVGLALGHVDEEATEAVGYTIYHQEPSERSLHFLLEKKCGWDGKEEKAPEEPTESVADKVRSKFARLLGK